MKKFILLGTLVIIVAALALSLRPGPVVENANLPAETTENVETQTQVEATNLESDKPIILKSSAPREKAWEAFQLYLAAAKNRDLKTVESLSHKLSNVCSAAMTNKSKETECFQRLDQGATIGSVYKLSDFPNVYSDTKQIIIFSNLKSGEDEKKKTVFRTLIYFTVDGKGIPRLLGIDPNRAFTILKEGLTTAEVDVKLAARMKDTDQDAKEDDTETCTVKLTNATCSQTDPNKKDSDGDGYWDSLEDKI